MSKYEKINNRVLKMLSSYLNDKSDYVDQNMIAELSAFGISESDAFLLVLQSAFNLDSTESPEDNIICSEYFPVIFKKLDADKYRANEYYKNIKIPEMKTGRWTLTTQAYQPYEAFVYDDMSMDKEGRLLPRVGYFCERYEYPAVLENGRIWMTITPNEIETMKEPIENAYGKVLTYGLGLGYFACMAAVNEKVRSVTVVERDGDVIDLFKRIILPQFKAADKVRIIQADAFEYAELQMGEEGYDYVFTDLWHDAGDGIDMYIKMKDYEDRLPDARFEYWIEKTIKLYL